MWDDALQLLQRESGKIFEKGSAIGSNMSSERGGCRLVKRTLLQYCAVLLCSGSCVCIVVNMVVCWN